MIIWNNDAGVYYLWDNCICFWKAQLNFRLKIVSTFQKAANKGCTKMLPKRRTFVHPTVVPHCRKADRTNSTFGFLPTHKANAEKPKELFFTNA